MSQTKTQLVATPFNVNGADLTFPSTQGSANQFLRNGSTAGTLEFATHRGFVTYAIICDEKVYNVGGGTFTSGAWRTRDLDTEIADPDGIVSIASNQFTLGAGTYLIDASSMAHDVKRHIQRIYNVTDSAVVGYGQPNYADPGGNGSGPARIVVRVTITGNTAFEIQHRCETTKANNGMGISNDITSGINNKYTIVNIFKEA